MKTNVISVRNNGEGWDNAFAETEKYAQYEQLSSKQTIHIRLLSEELMSMVESIAGDFSADFWIDDNENEYRIHLKATVNMDPDVREALLDASTSGKNAAATGIMGKLRDIFQIYLSDINSVSAIASTDFYGGYPGFSAYEMGAFSSSNMWSLSNYRDTMQGDMNYRDTESWDELEKSIIANIADEVTVGINGSHVEMIVIKKK